MEASKSYDFEAIISKCKNLWFFRQTVIVSGKTYVCGNYKIRGGVMSLGSAPKGIIIQVRIDEIIMDFRLSFVLSLHSANSTRSLTP